MNKIFILFVSIFLTISARGQVTLSAGNLEISLDSKGYFTEITDLISQKNYLAPDTIAPFITLVVDQKRYLPESLKYDIDRKVISLAYPQINALVEVAVLFRETHLTFEVINECYTFLDFSR